MRGYIQAIALKDQRAPSSRELESDSAIISAIIKSILTNILEKLTRDVYRSVWRRRSRMTGSSKGGASVGVENAHKAVVNTAEKKNL